MYLRGLGEVKVCDTGRSGWRKVAAYLAAAGSILVSARRRDAVYTSAPGQGSLWLYALVVLALRVRHIPFFVHHHSFRPINAGPVPAMRTVTALGGTRQRHVLLSDSMLRGFARLYLGDDPDRACVLSNAFLFSGSPSEAERPDRPLTLGHLSVLALEKGVDTVFAIFEQLMERGADVRLIVAGPVRDRALEPMMESLRSRFPDRFERRGRLDGDAKRRFYDDIDMFLLPSRLPDEAEPLVLLEAYAAGVDVMATARGCIPERLASVDRILTGDERADASAVLAVADRASVDWSTARRACRDHAGALHAAACQEAEVLFDAMALTPPGGLPAPTRPD